MRITLDLHAEALEAARRLAEQEGRPLGSVVSGLILKALQAGPARHSLNGLPVFAAGPDAEPITSDDVRRAEDDDG